MATEIKAWEIVGNQLKQLKTSLANEGKTEALDLEEWIASDSSIIRPGLKVIGRQVITWSGPLDLLAIDMAGNLALCVTNSLLLCFAWRKTPESVFSLPLHRGTH